MYEILTVLDPSAKELNVLGLLINWNNSTHLVASCSIRLSRKRIQDLSNARYKLLAE